MPSKSKWLATAADARGEMMTLAVVNTLQPVTDEALVDALSGEIERRRVRELVKSLCKKGLLTTLHTEEYVVTPRGRDAVFTPALKKQRDVRRMRHLFQMSKGGEGTEEA